MISPVLLSALAGSALAGGSTMTVVSNARVDTTVHKRRDAFRVTFNSSQGLLLASSPTQPSATVAANPELCLKNLGNRKAALVECPTTFSGQTPFQFQILSAFPSGIIFKSLLDGNCVDFSNGLDFGMVSCGLKNTIAPFNASKSTITYANTQYSLLTTSFSGYVRSSDLNPNIQSRIISNQNDIISYRGDTGAYCRLQVGDNQFIPNCYTTTVAFFRLRGPFNQVIYDAPLASAGTSTFSSDTSFYGPDASSSKQVTLQKQSQVPVTPNLQVQKEPSVVVLPKVFNLSFGITPLGFVGGYGSIISFRDGIGAPLVVRFAPGTTTMWVDFSRQDGFKNLQTSSLSAILNMGERSYVQINADEFKVQLIVNGILTANASTTPRLANVPSFYSVTDQVPDSSPAIAFLETPKLDFQSQSTPSPVLNTLSSLRDYSLSFDVTPASFAALQESLIDVVSGGMRFPAIYFVAAEYPAAQLRLRVRVATTEDVDEGIDNSYATFGIGCTTKVRVEVIGQEVYLYTNGTLDSFALLAGTRKENTTYLGDASPYYPSSSQLSPLILKQITTSTMAAKSPNGPLSRLGYIRPQVSIPKNFSLSFALAFTDYSPGLTNVLRYGQGTIDSPSGRLAVVYIHPTGVVIIFIATVEDRFEMLYSKTMLTPATETQIRVEVYGRDVYLFLNNTLDGYVQTLSDPIAGSVGPASLFLADTCNPPANAVLKSIAMQPLSSPSYVQQKRDAPLVPLGYFNKTILPENYSMSFSLTYLGAVSSQDYVSIVSFRRIFVGHSIYEKLPVVGLFMNPNTTKIRTLFYENDSLERVDTWKTLQVGQTVQVSLSVRASHVTLTVDGADSTVDLWNAPQQHDVMVYFSDPVYTAASAKLTNFRLTLG